MRRSLVESNSLKFNHLRQFSPDSDTCSDEEIKFFKTKGFWTDQPKPLPHSIIAIYGVLVTVV